jgi:hypothetical protein
MDSQKLVAKVFTEDAKAVQVREFIPVFHRWIQAHRVEGTLIDVADYSHLPKGPGVVLVGFEGDYFMDAGEGPLGLLYNRKTPIEGNLFERILSVFRSALTAGARLEGEPELKGRLRFRGGELLFLVNDRLAAPNTDETFAVLKPDLEVALGRLFPATSLQLRRANSDPRDRFGVRISAPTSESVAAVLARLG